MEIAERVKKISPSLTLAITAKAKAMKASGIDVVSFGAGEPNFNTPDYIIAAAKEALDKGMTKYTPVPGMEILRKAIAEKLSKELGVSYTFDQIVVSAGGKQTLRNAYETLLNPGDEVIIPSPFWLTYPELVRLSGGECVFVETDGAVAGEQQPFQNNSGKSRKGYYEKDQSAHFQQPFKPHGFCLYKRRNQSNRKGCREIRHLCNKRRDILKASLRRDFLFDRFGFSCDEGLNNHLFRPF